MENLGWSGAVGIVSERLRNLTIILGSWLSTKAETVLSQDEDSVVRAVGVKPSCMWSSVGLDRGQPTFFP